MITTIPEPLIIGTGALSIVLSLTFALLLATRRVHIKDNAGARCLRFTLRCSSEKVLVRHLRETPREEWPQLTRGFGILLDWRGHLHISDNAYVLLSERHYQSVGLLIAMALLAQTSTPYPHYKQKRLGAQYSKALRQAGVKDNELILIHETLQTLLPTWQIKVAAPPPS